jgi:hypothetical protein
VLIGADLPPVTRPWPPVRNRPGLDATIRHHAGWAHALVEDAIFVAASGVID